MVILEISVSHCGATTLKNICSSICLNKLRAERKGNVTCDSATESNLQWDQTAFFTLCWVHGFVVQVVMGHLERKFTGTPSSRHCDARAVGKMVSSCSLANGLKCFACRLISLLLQTRFFFGCSSKLCSFYNYSWQLQMQAKILSGPAHSDLHRSLNTEEKWYMVNESEAHMLEVGDRNWCIHSFLLLYLS